MSLDTARKSACATIAFGTAQTAANTPEKKALLEKRDQLEEQIDKLKYEKAAMAADDYRKQLQDLLIQLAKTQAELDK